MTDQPEDEKNSFQLREDFWELISSLIREIIVDSPTDIISYCVNYFEELQKRERNVRRADLPNQESSVSSALTEEANKSSNEKDDRSSQSDGSLKSQVQVSASLPLLNEDKSSKGLHLRETSSWNGPPSTSHTQDRHRGDILNMGEAETHIGDQASTMQTFGEATEVDGKMGDSFLHLHRDTLKSGDPIDSKVDETTWTMAIDEKSSEFLQQIECAQSSLMYEMEESSLRQHTETTSTDSVHQHPHSVTNRRKWKLPDGIKTKPELKIMPVGEGYDSDDSITTIYPHESDVPMKSCGGKISPNSSFGFIPHLEDHNDGLSLGVSQRDMADKTAGNPIGIISKNTQEIETLIKIFSRRFEDLASQFSSAEDNLNSQLRSAKEISDILSDYNTFPQKEDLNHDASLTISTEQIEKREIYIDGKKYEQTTCVGKFLNEELTKPVNKNLQFDDSSSEKVLKSSVVDTPPNLSYSEAVVDTELQQIMGEEISNSVKDTKFEARHKTSSESTDVQENANRDTQNSQENNPDESNSIQHQSTSEKKEYASDNSEVKKADRNQRGLKTETGITVNELWRRKWYESHPRLDSHRHPNYEYRHLNPRFPRFPVSRPFLPPPYRYQRQNAFSHIGEAGDSIARSRRSQTTGNTSHSCENSEYSSNSNIETNQDLDTSFTYKNSESPTEMNRSADDVPIRERGLAKDEFFTKATLENKKESVSEEMKLSTWRNDDGNQTPDNSNQGMVFNRFQLDQALGIANFAKDEAWAEWSDSIAEPDSGIRNHPNNLSEVVVVNEEKIEIGRTMDENLISPTKESGYWSQHSNGEPNNQFNANNYRDEKGPDNCQLSDISSQEFSNGYEYSNEFERSSFICTKREEESQEINNVDKDWPQFPNQVDSPPKRGEYFNLEENGFFEEANALRYFGQGFNFTGENAHSCLADESASAPLSCTTSSGVETKMAEGDRASSDETQKVAKREETTTKQDDIEPGLNSAGGDFASVPADSIATDSQQDGEPCSTGTPISDESAGRSPESSAQGLTVTYFQKMMRNVLDEQKKDFQDEDELDFYSYSDADSSDLDSSDLSDEDYAGKL